MSTGGFAYGIPRYSTTHGELSATWPVMGPFAVSTVMYLDGLHFGVAAARPAQNANAKAQLTAYMLRCSSAGVTESKVTVSSWAGEIWELYLTIGTRIGAVP